MDPELKRLLEETKALAKDNHRLLRSIKRAQWWGLFGRIIIWAIVLIVPFLIYHQYLEPFFSAFSTTSTSTPRGLFGLPSSAEVQKLINSFKAGQ